MDEASLEGKPAEFAMPDVLVRLAVEADVVLTYRPGRYLSHLEATTIKVKHGVST